MNRKPVSFEIVDSQRTLYAGTEEQMLQVYEVIINDLKMLQAKYGSYRAKKMKVAYSKKPSGEVKLIQIHKIHIV